MLVMCKNIYIRSKINRAKMYELQCRMENKLFKKKFNKNFSTEGIQVALRRYYFWLRKITLSRVDEWNTLRKWINLIVLIRILSIIKIIGIITNYWFEISIKINTFKGLISN